jgi:hypothetical protein
VAKRPAVFGTLGRAWVSSVCFTPLSPCSAVVLVVASLFERAPHRLRARLVQFLHLLVKFLEVLSLDLPAVPSVLLVGPHISVELRHDLSEFATPEILPHDLTVYSSAASVVATAALSGFPSHCCVTHFALPHPGMGQEPRE